LKFNRFLCLQLRKRGDLPHAKRCTASPLTSRCIRKDPGANRSRHLPAPLSAPAYK
jgi:hypothetical protein